MLLSDVDIIKRVNNGSLQVDPFDPQMVQPSSLDVRLASSFRMYSPQYDEVDPLNIPPNLFVQIKEPNSKCKRITLFPGEFLLGCISEVLTLPDDLAAVVEGKSTLGRLGLLVHATAGFIDPGFSGQVTLEMSNVSPVPILLTPGMAIAQLCFMPMSSPVAKRYGHSDLGSKYQNQSGATAPRNPR